MRRRWQALPHWKNERLQYDVFGAVKAEKLGPLTPTVEALGTVREAHWLVGCPYFPAKGVGRRWRLSRFWERPVAPGHHPALAPGHPPALAPQPSPRSPSFLPAAQAHALSLPVAGRRAGPGWPGPRGRPWRVLLRL